MAFRFKTRPLRGNVTIFNIWTISPVGIGISGKNFLKIFLHLKTFRKRNKNLFRVDFFSFLSLTTKFYSIWTSPRTKSYSFWESPTTALVAQAALGGYIFIERMSGTTKKSKIWLGHQNGVKFGCHRHSNGEKFGCRGHPNGV